MPSLGTPRVGKQRKIETYVSWAHDTTNLLHRVEIGAQTTMHCEDLFVDDCCNRQAVEAIGECLPKLDIVPSLTLVVEAIDTVDRGALMVTTEDEEILRILDFVRQEKADCLKRLLASVHVITKEEIVCFWREATIFKQAEEIVVLAVDITADLRTQKNEYSIFSSLAHAQEANKHTLIGASSSSRIG